MGPEGRYLLRQLAQRINLADLPGVSAAVHRGGAIARGYLLRCQGEDPVLIVASSSAEMLEAALTHLPSLCDPYPAAVRMDQLLLPVLFRATNSFGYARAEFQPDFAVYMLKPLSDIRRALLLMPTHRWYRPDLPRTVRFLGSVSDCF